MTTRELVTLEGCVVRQDEPEKDASAGRVFFTAELVGHRNDLIRAVPEKLR
jgi:hypothetical protein